LGNIPAKLGEIIKANRLLLVLLLINVGLFLVNYPYGKFYAIADIPLFELNPSNELWRRLFLWQEQRGFGLEFGQDVGLTGLLGGLSLLSGIGLSSASTTYIYNLILFVLPAISVYFLASAFFYGDENRNKIAFFAGLWGNLNFYIYITGDHPLFLRKFPMIMIAFLLGALILVLKTGKKRYWLLFGVFSLLNLASFGAPAFFILGALLIFAYVIFYLVFESKNCRHDLLVIAGMAALFFSISAPGIVANVHLMFHTDFLKSPMFSQYTASLFQLHQEGLDNSGLLNSFRLIGTVNWGSIPGWKGSLVYPYYTIFTTNPVFILSSFFLPALAFGAIALKTNSTTRRRLAFLTTASIFFLFLIKGVNKPLGELFLWAMQNIPYFTIFRQPYDKAGIVLMITMCLAAGYGLTRLFNFAIKKGRRKVLKLTVMTLIVASLAVNAYPALTGDVFSKVSFFELPQAYYDLPKAVNADPALYKIAVLPELAYSNKLSWGYFGIGLHSWVLNKPVLVRSFTGSDIYSESMTMAILHEVSFLSGAHYPHNIYDEKAAILPNTNVTQNSTNLQRVKYFIYILEKSNVGKIIYRNDYKGIGSVDIQEVDLKKYRLLFETMQNNSLVKMDQDFGELTLYSVQNWKPLVYASSTTDSYRIPEYDVFLDTYYTNARYAVLASFLDYNVDKEFVQAKGNTKFPIYTYAPLFIAEYYHKVNGDLSIAKAQLNTDANKISSLEARVNALSQYLGAGWQYYDYIESQDEYDVYLKIPPPPPPTPSSEAIDVIDQIIATMYAEVDKDNLVLDSYVSEIENALAPSNVAELAERLSVPYVSNLRVSVTNRDRNAILDRLRDLRSTMSYQSTETAETLAGKEFVFSTNGKEGSFALNLTQINEYWYHAGAIYLEKGTFLGRKDFLTDSEIVLIRHNKSTAEEYPPKVSFYQINPGKFKILIENASSGFFLNFLESYSTSWKLYPAANSGFTRDIVSNSSFAYQLASEKTWFEGSDLARLSSDALFEQDHYLLNGFANSWYVNMSELVQNGWVTANPDGTYTVAFELYYEPQSYLSLSIIVGALVTVATYVIVLSTRIHGNIARQLRRGSLWIKGRVSKLE